VSSDVKQPATSPIFDVAPTRHEPRINLPDGASNEEQWPFQWSWPGLVNTVQTSTGIYVFTAVTLSRLAYTWRSIGATVGIQLLKNGSFQMAQTISAPSSGSVSVNIAEVAAGSVLAIRISAFGTGVSEGLWIGLR
jgi:hypothetical protein